MDPALAAHVVQSVEEIQGAAVNIDHVLSGVHAEVQKDIGLKTLPWHTNAGNELQALMWAKGQHQNALAREARGESVDWSAFRVSIQSTLVDRLRWLTKAAADSASQVRQDREAHRRLAATFVEPEAIPLKTSVFIGEASALLSALRNM